MSESRSEARGTLLSGRSRYRTMLKITEAVVQSQSLSDAFREIVGPLLELTGGELLSLCLHDPHRDRMINHYWKRNSETGEFDAAPMDKAAAGWAWTHQKPIAIPDIQREQRFPSCVPVWLNHGIRSYTVVPLSTPAHHFGALGLGKSVPEVPKSEDVKLLSSVALLGALVLERERAQRALKEQQSLVAISHAVSSSHDLDKLLLFILSSVRSIARCERTVLLLLDEDGTNLRVHRATPEWAPVLNRGSSLPMEDPISIQAIQTRKVAFFSQDDLHAIQAPLPRAMFEAGVQSVCSVPLITGNAVWGALNATTVIANAFGPGEAEYLEQVANQIATALQNAHANREIAQLKDRLAQEKRYLENEIRNAEWFDDIVGDSPALKLVQEYAAIVAETNSTVLITGETGTGKERIARMIHELSGRKERSFIKLNCAAIPNGLLESELFGHEKGAFTGAISRKIGRLELANKGTLLLDEVGEIPLELQPKLLRVLQDKEFERLGGTKTIRVDVRLIAATNRDLVRAVEQREFRSDLFYRLHVFPLHLPALRERREDIPKLILHFVKKCAARLHKRIDVIPDEAVRAMMQWRWPGNIRELENFVERSVILSEDNRLSPLLGELRELASRQTVDFEETLRDRERDHIIEILRQTRGTLSGPTGAAARLGLQRTTLQYKIQRLGISRMDYAS